MPQFSLSYSYRLCASYYSKCDRAFHFLHIAQQWWNEGGLSGTNLSYNCHQLPWLYKHIQAVYQEKKHNKTDSRHIRYSCKCLQGYKVTVKVTVGLRLRYAKYWEVQQLNIRKKCSFFLQYNYTQFLLIYNFFGKCKWYIAPHMQYATNDGYLASFLDLPVFTFCLRS